MWCLVLGVHGSGFGGCIRSAAVRFCDRSLHGLPPDHVRPACPAAFVLAATWPTFGFHFRHHGALPRRHLNDSVWFAAIARGACGRARLRARVFAWVSGDLGCGVLRPTARHCPRRRQRNSHWGHRSCRSTAPVTTVAVFLCRFSWVALLVVRIHRAGLGGYGLPGPRAPLITRLFLQYRCAHALRCFPAGSLAAGFRTFWLPVLSLDADARDCRTFAWRMAPAATYSGTWLRPSLALLRTGAGRAGHVLAPVPAAMRHPGVRRGLRVDHFFLAAVRSHRIRLLVRAASSRRWPVQAARWMRRFSVSATGAGHPLE